MNGAERNIEPAIRMRWARLLFAHWPVRPAEVAAILPPGLEPDTFDGDAWIGLVPFRMEDTHVRGVPPTLERVLGIHSFHECNVRTYARCGERTGVWFCSLDAERLLPVLGGRWLWGLNYVHSAFGVRRDGNRTTYAVRRRDGTSLHVEWECGDPLPPAAPGSLEHFLTERYTLFAARRGRLLAGRVVHAPWTLRHASATRLDDGLVGAAGFEVTGDPLVFAADGADTVGHALEPVDEAIAS